MQLLKHWLYCHVVHPYPTEPEKLELCCATNLTVLQINNWYVKVEALQSLSYSLNDDPAVLVHSPSQWVCDRLLLQDSGERCSDRRRSIQMQSLRCPKCAHRAVCTLYVHHTLLL